MTLSMIWREYVSQNPMRIEVLRFRRKFMIRSSSLAQAAFVGLGLATYALLMVYALLVPFGPQPFDIIQGQTFAMMFAVVLLLYSAISGEREKRTWDSLQAAPITNSQIIFGKFLGALWVIAVGYAACGPAIVIGAYKAADTKNWVDVALAECVSMSFVTLVAAMTLFFSARSRHSLTALGSMLGTLALGLLVWPVFSATVRIPEATSTFDMLHPFMAIEHIEMIASGHAQRQYRGVWIPGNAAWGWPQIDAYAMSVPVWLFWAMRTLTYAELNLRVGARRPTRGLA